MSTSDSDYSIDWLASDEDDYDSPERLSPQHKDTQTPPSSTTSPRESPPQTIHSGPIERNHHHDCESKEGERRLSGGDGDPTAAAAQGCTAVGQRAPPWAFWTTSEGAAAGKLRQTKKRAHSPGSEGHCVRPTPEDTEKEQFCRKRAELRCYIQPLSSILRGLTSGRYSQRLSSFQESVAMDRIQRIMGVLQNPNMGQRYVSIIVKMEDMLQSWFPHVVRASRPHQSGRAPRGDGDPAKKQKQHHTTTHRPQSSPVPQLSLEDQPSRASDGPPAGGAHSTAAPVKRVHGPQPVCSLKTPGRTASSPPPLPRHHLPEVTQDNAVSSSTDLQTDPHGRGGRHGRNSDPNPRRRQGAPPRPSRSAPRA